MGYYVVTPQEAETLRAEHESASKGNMRLGNILASLSLVNLVTFILSALLGWGDGALLISLVAFVIAGMCATVTYVEAWDAKKRREAVKTEWIDTEPRVGERV